MMSKQKTEHTEPSVQRTVDRFWFIARCFLSVVSGALFFVVVAHAQVDAGLDPLTATGLATTDIRAIIANIIRIFLGLLGLVALVIVLYGGFLWMTAAGNEEKIAKAKKLLVQGAVGLTIILSAYGITAFVISRFLSGTTGEGIVIQDEGLTPGGGRRGALGSSIVDTHYPIRNAKNIPRNTKILVTFKEPMKTDTIVGADGQAILANVVLRKTIADPGTSGMPLRATATTDGKTFVFAPPSLLGSPSEPISYTMRLEKGIAKADGNPAFGQFGTFYEWQFEVSTIVDNDPPQVESILPFPGTDAYARNVVVQINFTEAVDPTVVVGPTVTINPRDPRSKIRITKGEGQGSELIAGTVTIANEYRTAEFVTNVKCGTNSCGGDVFCLPKNETITVRVPSSILERAEQVGTADFSGALSVTGIVDLAGNVLDGNARTVKDAQQKDRFVADGPGEPPFVVGGARDGVKDDYEWSFKTNDTIDLTPPALEALDPAHGGAQIALDKEIRATFSKPLMASTFHAATVQLDSIVNNTPTRDINYWTSVIPLRPGENTISMLCGKTVNAKIMATKEKAIGVICHDPFAKNTVYAPTITAGVKDLYQNCYSPCSGPGCTGKTWQGYPSCKLP